MKIRNNYSLMGNLGCFTTSIIIKIAPTQADERPTQKQLQSLKGAGASHLITSVCCGTCSSFLIGSSFVSYVHLRQQLLSSSSEWEEKKETSPPTFSQTRHYLEDFADTFEERRSDPTRLAVLWNDFCLKMQRDLTELSVCLQRSEDCGCYPAACWPPSIFDVLPSTCVQRLDRRLRKKEFLLNPPHPWSLLHCLSTCLKTSHLLNGTWDRKPLNFASSSNSKITLDLCSFSILLPSF